MAVEPALRDQLLGAVPSLRAFAYSLTNSWDRTDDLVQDTLTRAWGCDGAVLTVWDDEKG